MKSDKGQIFTASCDQVQVCERCFAFCMPFCALEASLIQKTFTGFSCLSLDAFVLGGGGQRFHLNKPEDCFRLTPYFFSQFWIKVAFFVHFKLCSFIGKF